MEDDFRGAEHARYHPHDYDREEPPAPSVPRQINPRAVASGETRIPDELRGTAEGRRLHLTDRLLAAVRDVASAYNQYREIDYENTLGRAVTAAYALATDRYMPRELASLLDYITPEESAADVLADLFVMFAQACGEMERRGLKGYRSMPVFEAAAAWMRDNRPDVEVPGYLPQDAEPAWIPRQPIGRTTWRPGDTVRLNEVSAAIFNTPPIRRRVLMHIARERYKHTDEKHWTADHDDRHNSNDWIAIIVQELGEGIYSDLQPTTMREVMIKVAAVATAAAEALDRKDPDVAAVLAEMERKQQERDA